MDPLTAVSSVLTGISNMLSFLKTSDKYLDQAGQTGRDLNTVAAHFKDTSMADLTKLMRAEPLTILSQDCQHLEYLPSLLNVLNSVYTGYFLQAVSILTVVKNVEVIKTLDALNPNRDHTGFLMQGQGVKLSADFTDRISALEHMKHRLPSRLTVVKEEAQKQQDTVKVLYEAENLTFGKLVNVDILVPSLRDEKNTPKMVTVPITVRLIPMFTSEDTLTYIFSHRKGNESFLERIESVRSGRISLISDMIFCQDLIREYRKAAMKDKSGVMAEIVRRVNNNRKYGLLTRNPSLAISSNIYVISRQTARSLEAKVGYRFDQVSGREKMLAGTYAMIIAVVDDENEQIDIYYDGISQPSTISVRSLKTKATNKGPDASDIMRSLLEGRAPSF